MSDRKEIFRLKLAIEEDGKLSHGAARLGLRVCSWVYNHPQHRWECDEPFPMPAPQCGRFLWGICDKQAYRLLRELVDRGHLGYNGILGCPGKSHFRLIIPGRNFPASKDIFVRPSTDKKVHAKCDKKVRPCADKNVSPQISISLREEISNPKEEIRARSARQETKGKQQPPAADNAERLRLAAEQHFRNWRKKGVD